MGTRAAFWKGDPRDLKNREWLGGLAWDAYPSGIDGLENVKTEDQFLELVKEQSNRDDFAKPDGGWPFPWDKDVFLTAFTYAFFDGKLQVSCFHGGFKSLEQFEIDDDNEDFEGADDPTCFNVPAPSPYSRNQPDSIMVISPN